MADTELPKGLIHISGPVGIGKSIVGAIIARALKEELHVDVEIKELEYALTHPVPEQLSEWEKEMVRNTDWVITEKVILS